MADLQTQLSYFLNNLYAANVLSLPGIVATGRATGQTAAVAEVATYTVGSSDASFEISANLRPTTATNHSITVTCAYTDEGSQARTQTMGFFGSGGASVTWTIGHAGGTVAYQGIATHIRAKAGTTITIATAGTFTTVVYNVEGVIKKIA